MNSIKTICASCTCLLLSMTACYEETALPFGPPPPEYTALLLDDGQQFELDIERFKPIPDLVSFEVDSLYPEGVEFDFRRGRFLVGSLTEGTIGSVNVNGKYTALIEDEILGTTTVGLHVDNLWDRLYVAVSSRTDVSIAAIACYDLKTKKRVFYTDLAALLPDLPHFANDITNDCQGNLYVTDSRASVIYKVNPKGKASVLLQDDALIPTAGFGLNGITYHPSGFLLVATSDSQLFKVPTRDPQAFEALPLSVGGFDGLQIKGLNTVYAVSNSNSVVKLTSQDDWQSAQVDETFNTPEGFHPTTLARVYGGDVYVIDSGLSSLGSGATPAKSEFSLLKVTF